MTNYMTPDEARETVPCPLSRTFGKEPLTPNCRGDLCPIWCWKPRMASDPEFASAIKKEMHALAQDKSEKTGKTHNHAGFHAEAVAKVMRNPEGYGIKREEGHCGLGGPIT